MGIPVCNKNGLWLQFQKMQLKEYGSTYKITFSQQQKQQLLVNIRGNSWNRALQTILKGVVLAMPMAIIPTQKSQMITIQAVCTCSAVCSYNSQLVEFLDLEKVGFLALEKKSNDDFLR